MNIMLILPYDVEAKVKNTFASGNLDDYQSLNYPLTKVRG